MRYVADTNIVSEHAKPSPNQNVVRMVSIHQHEIAISTLTISEILVGLNRLPQSRRKERIDANLQWWLSFADEFVRLSAVGATPSYMDAQIAAVAATNNLTLVTRNVKDFDSFNRLRVENWFEEA